MDNFFILHLDNVRAQAEDILVDYCFENGAQGVSEDLDFLQEVDNYEPVTLEKKIKQLKVYFTKPPDRHFLEQISTKFDGVTFRVTSEENKDWSEEWKKGFHAFSLVDNLWVVPSWESSPSEAVRSLRVDPGMAFGTGTHETTKIMAKLIFDFAKTSGRKELSKGLENLRVLDVGTGTGILAMTCAILGARVIGNDIDAEALRVARENIEANGFGEDITISELSLERIEGQYNLVVANIIDGVLLKLGAELKSRVLPGGRLFLSGILQERYEHFVKNFIDEDFEIVKKLKLGEWMGLELVKK